MTSANSRTMVFRKVLERAVLAGFSGKGGVLFSGGFDSALLCFLAKRKKIDIVGYTISVAGHNQLTVLKAVNAAKQLSLKHRVVYVSREEYMKSFQILMPLFGKGLVDFDMPAVYAGLMKIRKDRGCLLSGFGCDELMGDRFNRFIGIERIYKRVESVIKQHQTLAKTAGKRMFFPFADKNVFSFIERMTVKEREKKSFLRSCFSEFKWEREAPLDPQENQVPEDLKKLACFLFRIRREE